MNFLIFFLLVAGLIILNNDVVSTELTFPSVDISFTGNVSSVSATGPLSSSGGSTPDISIIQSDTSTDGYLSSTDWDIFNEKQSEGSAFKIGNGTALPFSNFGLGNITDIWVNESGDTMTGDLIVLGQVNFTSNVTFSNRFHWDSDVGRATIGQTENLDPRAGLTVVGDLDVIHTSTETDDHAFEIDVDADGFGDVKAMDIVYQTGAITTGVDEAIILIEIDETEANGGDVAGVEVIATEALGGSPADIFALKAGALVNPILQLSGTFEDMDSANNSGTEALTAFTTTTTNVTIFASDNNYIIIGDAEKFEELEFILNTDSSNPGIKPTFEFSTGADTWTEFTPGDGTNGMRNTGVVVWRDADIPTWAVGGSNEYKIRIIRTTNNLNTVPIEGKVQISKDTEYGWNKDGDLTIKNINSSGTDDNYFLGNVGIVTDNPKHLLDVGGMEGIGAPGNLGIKSDSGALAIRIEENSGVEGWHIGVDVDGDLNFDDSNTGIKLTFQDETGNVGIGTQSPGKKLEIYGSSPALRIRDSGATAGATTAFIEFGGTDGGNWNRTGYVGDGSSPNTDIYLQAEVGDLHLGDSSGATVLNLQGGNVGIGTTSPTSLLHVGEDTFNAVPVKRNITISGEQINVDGEFAGLVFDNSVSGKTSEIVGFNVGDNNQAGLYFKVSNDASGATTAMTIKSTGEVGIGTTSPSAKLDIRGKLKIMDDAAIILLNDTSGGPTDGKVWRIKASDGRVNITREVESFGVVKEVNAMELIHVAITAVKMIVTGYGNFTKDLFVGDDLIVEGNVGIGVIDPDVKLEVNGQIKSTSNAAKGSIYAEATAPHISLIETGVTTDNSIWRMTADGEQFTMELINDAINSAVTFLEVDRTGMTVDQVVFPRGNVGIGTDAPTLDISIDDTNSGINGALGTVDLISNGFVAFSVLSGGNVRAQKSLDVTNFLSVDRIGDVIPTSGGALTVTATSHRVDTFGGAGADNIVSITGASEGSILILKSVSGARTPTFVDGGNLALAGNFAMGSEDFLVLWMDGGTYYELSRSFN